jgi:hypothetical protein
VRISASTVSRPGSPVGSARTRGAVFEPRQRRRVERAGEQAELERIERIERAAPALHRPAAALAHLVHALQRQQGVDPADVADRAGAVAERAGVPVSRLNVPEAAGRVFAGVAGPPMPLVPWMRIIARCRASGDRFRRPTSGPPG